MRYLLTAIAGLFVFRSFRAILRLCRPTTRASRSRIPSTRPALRASRAFSSAPSTTWAAKASPTTTRTRSTTAAASSTQQPNHQRPHAGPYIWNFRKDEGVDLSYVKDFADLNHPNAVSPPVNLFYIGWTADGEWCNYTVDVKAAGTYKVRALYSNQANTITFDINRKPAATCKLPVATGSPHTWNYAEIGTITFPQAGLQLLTFHYNTGNNFAFFEFEKVEAKGQ